jgi:hypothetical protein
VLAGKNKSTHVWIVPSEQHPGCCYVTRVDGDEPITEDFGCTVEGLKSPIRNDFIEFALEQYRVQPAMFTWEELPSAPWPQNFWLSS